MSSRNAIREDTLVSMNSEATGIDDLDARLIAHLAGSPRAGVMDLARTIGVATGSPIGVPVQRKIGTRPIIVKVQAMAACREVMRSAPDPKIRNTTLRKANPISGAASRKCLSAWAARRG